MPRIGASLLVLLLLAAGCEPAPEPTGPDGPGDTLQWEFATPGSLPLDVRADTGDRPYLYVTLKQGGLVVLGLQDEGDPTEAARLTAAAFDGLHAMAVAQQGSRLYVALGDFFAAAGSRAGLAVVDVEDPIAPVVAAQWTSAEVLTGATSVLVDGETAYLAAKRHGVFVFDLARPDTLVRIATVLPDPDFPTPNPQPVEHPNARGFARAGDLLYVANDAGGLRVLDVSDRTRPTEIARYINASMLGVQQAYNAVRVAGDVAYVTLDYCGLEILDVSDPASIRQLGWWNPWDCDTTANVWFNSPGHTNQIVLDEQRGLAHLSAGAGELVVVDVTDPGAPMLHAQYEHPAGNQAVWGLDVTPTTTYLAYITAVIPYQGTWAGVKAVTTLR